MVIYRSVDADGTVSFSDQPPADDSSTETITIDVPTAAEPAELEARLAAMRETTDRMAQDRREREAARAALVAAQRSSATPAATPAAPPAASPAAGIGAFWPAYTRPWHHRPRPPLRPVPVPPPGYDILQPGNSQLMRPIVSSRR